MRHIRTLNASLHALESEVVEFSRGIKGHLRVVANAGAISECLPADLAAFAGYVPQASSKLRGRIAAAVIEKGCYPIIQY